MSDYQLLTLAVRLLDTDRWQSVPQQAVEQFHQLQKEAGLGEFLQLWPGQTLPGIPNDPGVLQSMLVGGMAGAGLGYAGGALAEKVLPQNWQRHRLKRTLTALGAALGASPGALLGGSNLLAGKPFTELDILQTPYEKQSRSLLSGAGLLGAPAIDVDDFNYTLWNDPRVAGRLDVPTRAAATGVLEGARNLPGKPRSHWITPLDVGRMAAGMGVGWLSGALVGKTLGLLTGMPHSTQERLKNTGMYAGVIGQALPVLFGG